MVVYVPDFFFFLQFIENVCLMCHQCQRNDKGRVVRCLKCKRKRYCIPCLTKWYTVGLFALYHSVLVLSPYVFLLGLALWNLNCL
jgi:hypothetical protein